MAQVTINGIDEAKAMVGKTVGPSEWSTVTQADIDDFARLSGDDQWIHVDVERAERESPFGTTIAHGNLTLSLIDGVEQLETYFGQFLPQFLIALLSPILIFAVVAFVDLPVALVMLGFALLALLAPALWHKWDVKNSQRRQTAYASFAAEFLDSIQGLATLKAFGQGKTRADKLEVEARDLFRRTMWVLGTNSLARGITDTSIAGGAAAALIYGASRVEAGAMSLTALLVILMLGVEIFRPMRELRSVLETGTEPPGT